MEEAPPAVHALLSELCYVCWLLGRGDLAPARHHVAEAQRKAEDIGRRIRQWRREEACRHALQVRRRSVQLQRKAQYLQERSDLLLAQSALLRRQAPASPEAIPARKSPHSRRRLA